MKSGWRFTLFLVFALMTTDCRADLIILAAPDSSDPYYAAKADDIFDFHVGFARRVKGRDRVLILSDEESYDDYTEALGESRVAVAPMLDIWTRDFGTANPDNPVMFRYTAAGQGGGRRGQQSADMVQERLGELLVDTATPFRESDLLNDGGNFVEDGHGNVVLSRKFLRDNGLSESEGRREIRSLTGAVNVAFIEADEQGGLEHADGVVSFIAKNTLLINSYPDDPEYFRQLQTALSRSLPGVKIHEIVTAYDGSRIMDARFGSACGLYTNALVTPEKIYLPQFGVPQDQVALEQVRRLTTKEVVPVPTHQVCPMGGGVRCMSWQLRGREAKRFLNGF